MDIFDFGDALNHLRQGKKVARKGWDFSKGFIALGNVEPRKAEAFTFTPEGKEMIYRGGGYTTVWLAFRPWSAIQEDMLAQDWRVVE